MTSYERTFNNCYLFWTRYFKTSSKENRLPCFLFADKNLRFGPNFNIYIKMLELFLILSCKNRKNSRYLYPKKLTENSKAETLKIKYKIKKNCIRPSTAIGGFGAYVKTCKVEDYSGMRKRNIVMYSVISFLTRSVVGGF